MAIKQVRAFTLILVSPLLSAENLPVGIGPVSLRNYHMQVCPKEEAQQIYSKSCSKRLMLEFTVNLGR